MEVARSKKWIMGSQQKYILHLLKETRMSGCKPTNTPIDPNKNLRDNKQGAPVDTTQYQRLVGKLICLSHTWPNIAFSIGMVSQFIHSPSKEHLEVAYQILRYLKSSPKKSFTFQEG